MGEVIALDPIAAVFGINGALARAFHGYSPRDGQVAMARLVHEVARDGGGACCDAPCGTGKSLAYLAPMILRAVKRSERVIVATANIALQEQLVTKDLPALKSVLAPLLPGHEEWKFALLKGKGNYACLSLVNDPTQRQEWEGSLSPRELEELARVDAWALSSETGDKSELPFVVSESVWRMRSMDTEGCHGKACDHYDECFARAAHDRAADASVIVVNYHVLFAHLALRIETGRDVVLPEYHALVMDEAHEAGDIARDFFGHTLSEGRVKRIVEWARNARSQVRRVNVESSAEEGLELSTLADELESAGSKFFTALSDTMAPLLRKQPRVSTLRSDAPGCAAALASLSALIPYYETARRLAARIFARIDRAAKNGDLEGDTLKDARKVQRDAQRTGRAAEKALGWMEEACRDRTVEREPGELSCIHWIAAEETTRRGTTTTRLTWESRHVDLSAVLREHVWDRTRTIVACSATMTTGAGPTGWAWIKRQLGAPETARVLSVSSPFDFARQALLCLPSGAPDPKSARTEFDLFVCDVLARVARAAGGRTLGLFTSSRMAQTAASHLRATVNMSDDDFSCVEVLAQGDRPRTQLVEAFKRDETSVLCGTASLWTGVDVPGRACVCVVVDKLPFAPPGDPIMDALCERAVARNRGKEIAGFMEESLPRAVLALRQGVGRLIRSTSDWGCVVLCDPRLSTKGYGAEVLRALGMPTRTRDVSEACAWLKRGVMQMQAESNRSAVNE